MLRQVARRPPLRPARGSPDRRPTSKTRPRGRTTASGGGLERQRASRLQTVASRRPRSLACWRTRGSLRPCDARFSLGRARQSFSRLPFTALFGFADDISWEGPNSEGMPMALELPDRRPDDLSRHSGRREPDDGSEFWSFTDTSSSARSSSGPSSRSRASTTTRSLGTTPSPHGVPARTRSPARSACSTSS